jgi:hypothetical protein
MLSVEYLRLSWWWRFIFMIGTVLGHCTLQHISKIRIELHQVQQCLSNKIKSLQASANNAHHQKATNTKTHCTEHHKPPSTHTRTTTHNTDDLLWRNTTITGTQQDFNELKNCINFNKSVLTILSPSVTHTWQHACNICEAFPFKCWSLSDDGHHWPKHVEAWFHY